VFRPRVALLTAIALSAVLVGATALGWLLLPADIQRQFTGIQLATLVFFVIVMLAIMLAVGLSVVVVSDSGVVVRNGLRTHHFTWPEIRGFRFTADDPWAYVELVGEPETRPLVAVQRVDGERAAAAVDTLRAALARGRAT